MKVSKWFGHEELHSKAFPVGSNLVHPVHLYRLDSLRDEVGSRVVANRYSANLALRGARTHRQQLGLIGLLKTTAWNSYHIPRKLDAKKVDKDYTTIPSEYQEYIKYPSGNKFCLATDIELPDFMPEIAWSSLWIYKVVTMLREAGFTGIIVYRKKRFFHVDSRDLAGAKPYFSNK